MAIEAKIIEHSVAAHGKPLQTVQLRYPRFIHAELMTHRVFSRNASSSRAIPVAKMIEQVRTAPAMPIHWGKNQPGMQANEQLVGEELANAQYLWRVAAKQAADTAEAMNAMGVHKQVANRILEPFLHISVIVSTTEYANWRALRKHPDAQPEIHELAIQWDAALEASTPVQRGFNVADAMNWHLPYVSAEERQEHRTDPLYLAKLSAARCARVSYLTHDGRMPNAAEDLYLYERLVGSKPLHASPIEHQAHPLMVAHDQSNNFFGWLQHRQLVERSFA